MEVSTKQLADIFHVTERTVQLWAKGGCPKAGHGKWNMQDVVAWWADNIYGGNVPDSDETAKAKQDYWKAKARTEEARSRNEKIKADLAEEKVLPLDEIKKAWAWRINEVSTGLGMIPLRLSPLLVGKPEMEIRKILDNELWKIRDNYARTGKFIPELDTE